MGKSGFNGSKPPGFKNASWVGQGQEVDESGKRIDGICGGCGEWDAELKSGYCRDRECIDKRRDRSIKAGNAVRIIDGLPGGACRITTKRGTIITND